MTKKERLEVIKATGGTRLIAVEAAFSEIRTRVDNASTRIGLIEAEGKQRSRRLNDKRLLQLLEATASTLALAIEELKAGIGPSALTWALLAATSGLILPFIVGIARA